MLGSYIPTYCETAGTKIIFPFGAKTPPKNALGWDPGEPSP